MPVKISIECLLPARVSQIFVKMFINALYDKSPTYLEIHDMSLSASRYVAFPVLRCTCTGFSISAALSWLSEYSFVALTLAYTRFDRRKGSINAIPTKTRFTLRATRDVLFRAFRSDVKMAGVKLSLRHFASVIRLKSAPHRHRDQAFDWLHRK